MMSKGKEITGVSIDGIHSYRDLGLVLREMDLSQPEPILKYIQVPGRSTVIDATEALYGKTTYRNRQIKFVFRGFSTSRQEWLSKVSNISNRLHGRRCQVVLDDDPEWYWIGRVTVDADKTAKYWDDLTISIDAEPFKYQSSTPDNNWLWDTFNFETGYIQNLRTIPVNGAAEFNIVSPNDLISEITLEASKDMLATIKGRSFKLAGGKKTRLPGIRLAKMEQAAVRVKGTGTVTVIFEEESL